MELTLDEYLTIATKVIKKYAPSLLKDEENVGEVARYMMLADQKFNGTGTRHGYRASWGKFRIRSILHKKKSQKAQMRQQQQEVCDDVLYPNGKTKPYRDRKMCHEDLEQLLSFCPNKYLDTMKAYFLESKTLEEIAAQEMLSHQAIDSRIKFCLKKMRKKLNERNITINDFIN